MESTSVIVSARGLEFFRTKSAPTALNIFNAIKLHYKKLVSTMCQNTCSQEDQKAIL